MPKSTPDRHAALLRAGWIYDAAQDRYREPGSDPKRATWRNLAAAWLRHQTLAAQPAQEPPAHEQP